MAVRIRMKRMGRRHRPFFRICAMDSHSPRDGRVIEELGHYDPMVRETDARVMLNRERVDYWLGVGAQPTPKMAVLIRKYGTAGTHLSENEAALGKLDEDRKHHGPPEGFKTQVVKTEDKAEAPEAEGEQAEAPAESEAAPAEATSEQASETPAAETPATEEKPSE